MNRPPAGVVFAYWGIMRNEGGAGPNCRMPLKVGRGAEYLIP